MNNPPKSLQTQVQTDLAEYQVIKKDLTKVLILNSVYVIALLTLYFTNEKTHYLENFFSKILHF